MTLKLTKEVSRMTAAQVLSEPKQQASDFLSFLYQNLNLVLVMFAGFLLTRLVAILFLKILHSRPTKRLFSLEILFLTCCQTVKHLPKLSILFLAFALFRFILVTLLSNCIKTDKIVVDTSFLIDSVEKLEVTNNKPIFVG